MYGFVNCDMPQKKQDFLSLSADSYKSFDSRKKMMYHNLTIDFTTNTVCGMTIKKLKDQ